MSNIKKVYIKRVFRCGKTAKSPMIHLPKQWVEAIGDPEFVKLVLNAEDKKIIMEPVET